MLLGIDASSTNTALTFLDEEGNFQSSILLTPNKKLCLEERGTEIVKDVISAVAEHTITHAAIEYSSFGSKGRVVDLSALNGGIMYSLLIQGIPVQKFAPTSIKKFATDNGRADKDQMASAMPEGILAGYKKDHKKVDDLVDSYFIAKMLHSKL